MFLFFNLIYELIKYNEYIIAVHDVDNSELFAFIYNLFFYCLLLMFIFI